MPDPDLHDRRQPSRYDDPVHVQDCLDVIAADNARLARNDRRQTGVGDLDGYDAARDEGRYAAHMEQWLDEAEQ